MSGNQGGGAATGALIGGGAGFLVGGPVGAAVGAGLGTAVGSTIGAQQDAKRQQKTLAGQLMQPIKTPRVLPTIDSKTVEAARNNKLFQLQNRSGRGSTILTNSSTFGG